MDSTAAPRGAIGGRRVLDSDQDGVMELQELV